MKFSCDSRRIRRDLEALAQFTATPGRGVTRFSFTPEDRLARNYIKDRMAEAGLKVYEDAAGSVFGRREGKLPGPVVMFGSHYDSVRHGGIFDGAAGVAAALEAARTLSERGVATALPLEFAALIEEEGGRFGRPLFASRVMTGLVQPEELEAAKDADGVTLAEAMRQFGLQPENIAAARRSPASLKAFLELHVEQGPVLEAEGKDLGIVDTIVGISQFELTFTGRPDHAGTTPMLHRADALVAAAAAINEINALARAAGPGTVATVGNIAVSPGAANIVPGTAVLSLDVRSVDAAKISGLVEALKSFLAKLPESHGVQVNIAPGVAVPPTRFDPKITAMLTAAAAGRGLAARTMPSGAGHDAMVMAAIAPAGLVFVPSRGGRSHCPEEATDFEQIAAATDVCLEVILQLAAG